MAALKRENGDHFRDTLLSRGGKARRHGAVRQNFSARDPYVQPLLSAAASRRCAGHRRNKPKVMPAPCRIDAAQVSCAAFSLVATSGCAVVRVTQPDCVSRRCPSCGEPLPVPVLSRCSPCCRSCRSGEAALAFDPGQRLAFVTSVQGTANLQSQVDSGGHTGPGRGRCHLRRLSHGGELPAPDQFVAWLSDSSDDAYCRLHGLHGQRAGNCGQASLPKSGGPRSSVDGAAVRGRRGRSHRQWPGVPHLTSTNMANPARQPWPGRRPSAMAPGIFLYDMPDWSSAAAASSSPGIAGRHDGGMERRQGLNCATRPCTACKGKAAPCRRPGTVAAPAFLPATGTG